MPLATLRRYFRHGLFPQLVVFEAVARLGSVTRAANELHLAQPTVSMQLKKLSQTLEVTLFEPDGRGVRITPAGEALLEVCRELGDLFGRAEERLSPHRRNRGSGIQVPLERLARLAADFAPRR
jgi:DNA-binding transcriptional LysR family regulator